MTQSRFKISDTLRERMAYDKLAGPEPRLLILESRYWLDGACRNAAERMGWDVQCVPVTVEGVMSRERIEGLLAALIEFRPDFILAVNLSGMDEEGLFAGLFEDLHVPYVAWFVDDPRTILMGRSVYASEYTVALTWERAYEDYLRGVGFPVVQTLPLAVDDTVFNAPPADSWEVRPAFVGNSMEHFADREWAWIAENTQASEAIREAFDEGRVTRESFIEGLNVLLDPGIVEQLDIHGRRHAEMLFFIEGTRRLRHEVMDALGSGNIDIRGDEGWQRSFPHASTPINYEHDLPIFYRQCEVNLNITSIQMKSAVNQRVFDCAAAGGFLLTDAQASLAELFDVRSEVACYDGPEECRELLRFYRAHPEARVPIITKARKRVLGEHTYEHRLETIRRLIRERFG